MAAPAAVGRWMNAAGGSVALLQWFVITLQHGAGRCGGRVALQVSDRLQDRLEVAPRRRRRPQTALSL